MKLAKIGYLFRPTSSVLLWLLVLTAALLLPAAALAQDQSQSGGVQLEVQVGTGGQPGDQGQTNPVSSGELPPPPPQMGAQGVPGQGAYGDGLNPPPVPGGDTNALPSLPPTPPLPGSEANALPNVPPDAPPPVPPAMPSAENTEAEEIPQTPEEQQALEAKRAFHSKLDEWHSNVMRGYVFSASMVSDPFMPIESVARPPEDEALKAEENRMRLPILQRLALNQFTLNAIIVAANPGDSTALVDSGGRGFILHRGTLIGPNNGYVKEISSNRVVIEEPEVDYRGNSKVKETVFRLNTLEDEVGSEGAIIDGNSVLFQQPEDGEFGEDSDGASFGSDPMNNDSTQVGAYPN
jgi:Tfp pilus assembly protein PilP